MSAILRIFIKYWPLLIVLLLLIGWGIWLARKKRKQEPIHPWQVKLWFGALGLCLVTLAALILWLGLSQSSEDIKTRYVPAQYQDGKIVPGYKLSDEDAGP